MRANVFAWRASVFGWLEDFALVAHLGDTAALFDGEVQQFETEGRFQGVECGIKGGPFRIADPEVADVLCPGGRTVVDRAIPGVSKCVPHPV